MNRSPFRSARAASTDDSEPSLIDALAELGAARAKCEHLRRLVAHGEAGAASLGVAEWEVAQALRRVDRLRSRADHQPPLDAA